MRTLAAFLGVLAVFSPWLLINLIKARSSVGVLAFGDFPALWSYGRIELTHPAALPYDFEGLHAAQVDLGMEAKWHYPFPYPPHMLFLLRPLGLASLDASMVIWIAAQLAFYLWAVLGDDGSPTGRSALKWPAAPAMAAALLLTPTAIFTIMQGQSGFLAAGLLVGGIRRAKARPLLGGILLGLLTYKPQLGLLVPVALLAAGWWRCATAACLTTVALVTLSSATFGWDIWPVWIGSLPGYQVWFSDLRNTQLMPTVSVSLGVLGVPAIVAELAQWTAAAIAAAATWRCFRDGCPTLAMAALVGATCLANPHAFFYDLPMLDAAVVLLVTQRLRDGADLALPELLLFLAVLLFPSLMVIITMPLGPLILGLFVARLTALQSRHRARAGAIAAIPVVA